MRALLENTADAYMVAAVPRLHLLLRESAHSDSVLQRQPHLLVRGRHIIFHLHLLRHLHEVEPGGGTLREESHLQK